MKIGNLRIFEENCKVAFLSGRGINQGNISIGNGLYASSSIGKYRDNQEDAVVLVKHPNDEKIKLLAVADGVGGQEAGEVASSIAINEIKEWFENLEEEYFSDMRELELLVNMKLNEINKKINQLVHRGANPATTFVCAIVGKSDTLIVNIGDSRAYIYKKGELKQITKDHSKVMNLYKRGIIKRKDDVRFFKGANYIYNSLGAATKYAEPDYFVLKNDEYDALLLFSDGVTDCLSDDQILAVARKTDKAELSSKLVKILKTIRKENIAEQFVKEALNTDSKKRQELGDDYEDEIKGGKDNTTAAVYYPETDEK